MTGLSPVGNVSWTHALKCYKVPRARNPIIMNDPCYFTAVITEVGSSYATSQC